MVLTDRRASILEMVVDQYVRTAEPVSSRALVALRHLGVSSATIRNELARLEEDGYVTHPYTSAGRVPSHLGYRHYVETLMAEEPIGPDEQRTIEHQLHQVIGGLDEWLSLAATILATHVSNVAVVTRPRSGVTQLKHAQLVELGADSVLLVAVLDDGRVMQRIVTLTAPESQARLVERAGRINARLADTSAEEIREHAASFGDAEDGALATAIADMIDEHRIAEETFVDGVRLVLSQPEFADADRMLDAVEYLDAYRVRGLIETTAGVGVGATRVLIGQELGELAMGGPTDGPMDGWSVIVSGYGEIQGAAGHVAVLGPMRMDYRRTVPRVRYVAELMGQLLHEVQAS